MNILSQITEILTDESRSLSSGLLKLKLLGLRIGNQELLTWVDKELKGYDGKDLPDYRITRGILKGTFYNGYSIQPNESIPTWDFPQYIQDYVNSVKIKENISIIQQMIDKEQKDEKGNISVLVPAEMVSIISNHYRKNNENFRIGEFILQNVYVFINPNVFKNILEIVRNNALDLIFELAKVLGYEVEIEEIIKRKDESNKIIHQYMTQNNIINNGDGYLVNTGSENTITQNINIQKGNWEQLKEVLTKTGLDEEDLNEVEVILRDDKTEYVNKVTKSKEWMQRMAIKYWDAGKDIGKGAIGSILGDLIGGYLGIQ